MKDTGHRLKSTATLKSGRKGGLLVVKNVMAGGKVSNGTLCVGGSVTAPVKINRFIICNSTIARQQKLASRNRETICSLCGNLLWGHFSDLPIEFPLQGRLQLYMDLKAAQSRGLRWPLFWKCWLFLETIVCPPLLEYMDCESGSVMDLKSNKESHVTLLPSYALKILFCVATVNYPACSYISPFLHK